MAELVGAEILRLLRTGTPAEEILVVCPALDRWRAPLDAAFCSLGVPYALDGTLAFGRTGLGSALVSLLRFTWLGGGRGDLYAYLRSPYSGCRVRTSTTSRVACEAAVSSPERVEEETVKLRGRPIPFLGELREGALATRRRPRARALPPHRCLRAGRAPGSAAAHNSTCGPGRP